MAGKCAKYGDDYVMGSELDTTDSEHSGSDNEEFVPPKKEATTRRGVERQPTRRPDPNVSNRNALLARENRRRKKEHLQELETQVEKFQADNSSMRKTIKQQAKMIKKLQKEKTYYKNLLQSQPQIVNVLERFNNNFKGNIYSSGAAKSLSPSSTGSSSPFSVDFNDNGTLLNNNDLMSLPVPDIIDSLLSDINSVDYKSHDPTDYDLFGVNSPFHTAATPEYFSSTDCLSSISEEHNYTLDTPPTSSGICLHIAGDKVSVEFCSVCCENAKTVEGII
ncbi:hypothetical protein ACFFRR_008427 [Megaselia abdita]